MNLRAFFYFYPFCYSGNYRGPPIINNSPYLFSNHISCIFINGQVVTVTAVTMSALTINQSLIIKTLLLCYFFANLER
jgi:hypothetical protein